MFGKTIGPLMLLVMLALLAPLARTGYPTFRKRLLALKELQGKKQSLMTDRLQLDATHKADLVQLNAAVNNILDSATTTWPSYGEQG